VDDYGAASNVTIISHLGYVSHKLESRLFNECDVVWLGYSKRFVSSSGVLYQAWSAEKPVIACDHGLIGLRVKNNNAGITVDIDNLVQIRNAIFLLGQKGNDFEQLRLHAKLAGQKHTKAAFIKSLMNTIYV
jgi:glycosyltransferase involved in cell wall biosynthesis